MRVVHVDAERGFSGGEVQVFLLIEGLRKRGVDCVLVVPPGSKAAAEAERRGITVRTVAMRHDLDLGAVLSLRKLLAREAPDLVHLHTGRATWLGGIAARWQGVPALTTRRMDRVIKRGLRTRLIYGSLVRSAVAISPAVERALRSAEVGCPIELISSSVDPGALTPSRPRSELRAELGLEGEVMTLLVLASLVRRKGIDVLLEALRQSLGDEPLVLLVAGDGPERGALEAQAGALPSHLLVRFLGRREDPADLLAASDVFCLPSRKEGLGVAALEAMAAGKPVVATRVGGLGEAIVDGESGLLVEPEDAVGLARAIERLRRDRSLGEKLGAGGRARVTECFLAEHMVSAYHDLYGRLVR